MLIALMNTISRLDKANVKEISPNTAKLHCLETENLKIPTINIEAILANIKFTPTRILLFISENTAATEHNP